MVHDLHKQPLQMLAWMGALADSTRLRLLILLGEQELGVAEICEVLQMPQSTVSRHLKVLGDQGWVHHRRQGTANLYQQLGDELNPAQAELWDFVQQQSRSWPELEQDKLRLREHLARRGDDSRSFFASAAAQWDDMRVELYGDLFALAAVAELLPENWVVADLGCGTGQVSVEMARRVGKVIGVDHSVEMLEAARRRAKGLGNIELHQAGLDALPIADNTCDAALILLALTYVEDPLPVLTEAARIVRVGGRVVVVDLLNHDREDFRLTMGQRCLGFERGQMKDLFAQAGLSQAKARPLSPDVRAKGPALLLASGCC